MESVERLHELVSAVCPIRGVKIAADGTVSINFDNSATVEERAAGQSVADSFDTSPSAHATWERQKRRDAAVALLNSSEPTMIAVRALATVVKRRVSTLLVALGKTPLTTTQLVGLWADCIADGEVDETITPNGG